MDKYGVCNVCGKSFQPKIKNGKIISSKYYCSDLCYETPIFKSKCKYCNKEIIISGEEFRRRRGKLPIVCLNEKCIQKAKENRYSKINYKQIYKNSLKEKLCKFCGKIFIEGSLSLYCETCSYEMNHKICINCGKTFELPRADSDLSVCKDCIIGEEQRYVNYCDDRTYNNCKFNIDCSRYFYYGSPQNINCQKQNQCIHGKNILYCQECSPRVKVKLYNELINKEHIIINENLFILINKNNDNLNKKVYNKICKTCGMSFKGLSPISNWCGNCYYILKCKGCDNIFLSRTNNQLVCEQECSGIYFHKQGYDTHIYELEKNYNLDKNIIKIDLAPYTEITKINLDDFKGISGIWFKSSKNIVLDVCITKDIYSDIDYHFYALNNKINSKYSKMSEHKDIKFYYLNSFDSWENGLIKEFKFAIGSHAKYWSPAPGIQMTLFSKLNKEM